MEFEQFVVGRASSPPLRARRAAAAMTPCGGRLGLCGDSSNAAPLQAPPPLGRGTIRRMVRGPRAVMASAAKAPSVARASSPNGGAEWSRPAGTAPPARP